MTSSGKVRIYELSRDLGLENKDVLDAAEQLGVAAKSHSSSISDDEAARIRKLLEKGGNGSAAPAAGPAKAILTVKKAPPTPGPSATPPAAAAPAKPVTPRPMASAQPAPPAILRLPFQIMALHGRAEHPQPDRAGRHLAAEIQPVEIQ